MRKKILAVILLAILAASPLAFAVGPPGSGSGTDPRIGTLTNTKWCYSDGSQVLCTQDAPAGVGDFLANGTVPMAGAIIPDSAGGQTIGTTSAEFGHIYLHDSKSIYFQANQSLYLTGAAGALSLTGGNFTPGAATLTLGSTAAEWGGLYLGDGKIIYGQADQSNTITSSATGWVFNLPITTQSAVLTGGTNTFNLTNGTASLDVAAAAALNIDTSLQVATGAVVINGNAGGSSSLTLGNFALSLGGTMTDGRLCTYASSGTAISCNTATTTFQAADADLTTWAGITPSANMQTWLASADLAAMKAGLSVDDLVTLSGVADGAVNLGEFTGSTITDNQTVKASLQLLETATEARLPLAGGTMTGVLVGTTPAAGASGYASIRLPHGAAPTDNLTNGDCWTTTAGLYCHINGSTVGPFASSAGTGYATIQEEGGNLTQRTLLNFVGGGFTAADDSGNTRTNVTLDADLNTIAGLTVAQGKVIIGSASPAWSVSDFSMAGGTNTFSISNGTASLDVAAGSTLDVNANATINTALTVQTGAVTLTGDAGGSTLTLPTAISLAGTMADGRLCTYASSGTAISCNTATSTFQTADAELTAVAGLTFADASIIQLTGAAAAAVLTSGGNNYVLKATSDNSALEFAAPTGTGAPVLGTAPSFTTSITPNSAGASTIGTTSLEWGNVYLTDSAVIYGQADQSATLTSSASTWTASAFTVTGTLTANGNATFGNADTDTLTLRSLLVGGNSRAVWIAGSAPTPTYATGTDDLYVGDDIEAAGTVYATSFEATGTGESYMTFANNASTPEATITNGLYFVGNVLKVKENGTERDVVTPADSVTWTGTSHSFAGVTNLILPTATPDANGEIAINNTNETLLLYVNSALKTIDFSSDSAGYVLKSNGSGTFTLQEDATGGTPTLDSVGDPSGDTTIEMGAGEEVNFNYTGNFTTGSQFKIEQLTGNPSGGVLFEVKAADTDITLARLGDGTNYLQISQGGNVSHAGTSVFTAPRVATSIAPSAADGATLGTSSLEFSDLYLADGGVINLGNDQDVTLTHIADTGVRLNAAMQLQFRDENIYVASLNDGYLDLEADTGVRLNAPVTVGGTLALGANSITMSGSIGVTGTRVTKGWFTDLEVTNAIAGSVTGNAATVTVADEASDTTCFPMFATAATGSLGGKTNAGLTFNSSTGVLTATGFAGPLTGNVTGNASGTAATVTGAAQANITSVGTLTGLTVSGAIIPNGANTIALGSAAAEWADIYLGDGAVIYGENDSSNTITSSATGWTFAKAIIANETAGIQVGATGVKITSDNDGAITFLGTSAGYDEDLTINLDDTENTAVFSSSTGVTKLDFSALNLATTGIITGAMNTNSDANGMSAAEMTTAGMYGTMFWATGAGTWALPGAATGMNFCVYSTTAAAIVINPDDGDTIVLNGTALSAGDSITSASGAGDFICLLAKDANTWYTLGRSGAWTDTN